MPRRSRNCIRFGRSLRRLVAVGAGLSASVLAPGWLASGGPAPGWPARARADGAFFEAETILLLPDRPRQIIMGTTFGLVISDDDGATWRYACETDETTSGRMYTLGAPPAYRIHTVSARGAAVTEDLGCSWTLAAGELSDALVVDVFPDRVDPLRSVALGAPVATVDSLVSVYMSTDGGRTYQGPLFEPPQTGTLTGVELAAGAPGTIYVTMYERPGLRPRLARTIDGGANWVVIDVQPMLGLVAPFIAAVDPVDHQKVYLRVSGFNPAGTSIEGLAITTDGGDTWSIPVQVPGGALTSFLRRQDGTILVTALGVGGVDLGFRSQDGGRTFVDWPLAFSPGGLGERGDTLFMVTKNFKEGFALASSEDGGHNWTPRMRFKDVSSVPECLLQTCEFDCDLRAGTGMWPPETCRPSPDGGSASGGASGSGGVSGSGGSSGGGCACSLRPRPAPPDARPQGGAGQGGEAGWVDGWLGGWPRRIEGGAAAATAGTLGVLALWIRRRGRRRRRGSEGG